MSRTENFQRVCDNLINCGRRQGCLTAGAIKEAFESIHATADELRNFLRAAEDSGIEIENDLENDCVPFEGAPFEGAKSWDFDGTESATIKFPGIGFDEGEQRWNNDPVHLYMDQMSDIPLLTREDEMILSKRIERARRRYRRAVLAAPFSIEAATLNIEMVLDQRLAFDRNMHKSISVRLSKEQVLRRIPTQLSTLHKMIDSMKNDWHQFHSLRSSAKPAGRTLFPGAKTLSRDTKPSANRSSFV